jgi:formyltetrahydrofolate deformylase
MIMTGSFVLTLSCEDRPGIVAAVTTELAAFGGNIAESNQFWDRGTNRFFMRIAFQAPGGIGKDDVERALKPAIERFGMKTEIIDAGRRPKVVVMVSKFDHALLHLLY